MAKIAVTILATTPQEFAVRIDRIKPFAKRIHVDISDGVFAPQRTIGLSQAYGVDGAELELHMMVAGPSDQIENMLALKPHLIILHFESNGDLVGLFNQIKAVGIKAGLAIKQETTVDQVEELLTLVDHLLVFTGHLGHNGGEMDQTALVKIAQAKAINPNLEVAVDGGVNLETAQLALSAGADVLDTGSYVHEAADPRTAYLTLESML